MKKYLAAVALALISSSSFAYYCSYTTYISNDDKFNTSGKFLGNSVTKKAAAAILRQERTYAGSWECGLGDADSRARFEEKVKRSNLSPVVIKRIVRGNPTVRVEIYDSYVKVY
ncbi:hypothetical protein SAMN02745664_102165 [Moraxella cuniculi DSM 21768]|uniref:Uncharacterized protein n=1 Tax=Moraxella cuniculi DSM 21768 TaxID=1122245 RepID=A0A1N7DVY1_9GAMM|nr:hypothetical protein [Moraxella cuniculi]OOS07393.1 hypothetical protein B0189_02915 [Moraxella cuniculi]SIR79984.1 hypothetical protein SAMN02745664_102165 [Moraxella cuniculi DSM 21768]